MRLSRWLILVAAMVVFGGLKVMQHNALFLKGYAVGERLQRLRTMEHDVTWINAHVVGLSSPHRLFAVMEQRELKLVAWSPLIPPSLTADHSVRRLQQARSDRGSDGAESLVHIAAGNFSAPVSNDAGAD